MFGKQDVNQSHWIDEFKSHNALWIHDGNPKHPHVRLTSGVHSDGFFNSRLVIADEEFLREATHDLLRSFVRSGGYPLKIEGFVGPQTGATKLAEFLKAQLFISTGKEVLSASPAKYEHDNRKTFVFSDKERALLRGKLLLLCEDALTTGGSIDAVEKAVIDAGGTVLPYVLVLVNRSGLSEISGKKIVALINRRVATWKPEECPLCKGGSQVIPNPKDNWASLNA